jgi:hypothetical protein
MLFNYAQFSLSSGRLIADLFMELPDREEYPDYYLTIKNPIALDMIRVCARKYVDTEHSYTTLNGDCLPGQNNSWMSFNFTSQNL